MKDINLLPDDVKSTPTYSGESTSHVKKISGLTIVLIVFFIIFAAASIAVPKLILMKLEADATKISESLNSKEYQEVKQLSAKITSADKAVGTKNSIITAIDSKSYPVSELLNAIKRSAPKGCYITEVKTDDNKMEIGGYATSSLLIAELISNLDRLDTFNRIGQTDTVKYEKANAAYKFRISYNLVGKGEKK